MTEHTPGPWRIAGPSEYPPRIVGAGKYGQVASASRRTNKAEIEANTRLIAAAPELLEACESALIPLDYGSDLSPELEWLRDKLRAVIAKAEAPA